MNAPKTRTTSTPKCTCCEGTGWVDNGRSWDGTYLEKPCEECEGTGEANNGSWGSVWEDESDDVE